MEIRALPGVSELPQLEALLNEGFAVAAGASFYDDFPVWDPRFTELDSTTQRLGLFESGRLASATLVRIARLKTPAGIALPVAIVGGVVTRPESRGRGYASRLVSQACDWAREKGAAFVLLWGSEHALYQRLGFELCGEQIRVPLGELVFQAAPGADIAVTAGWTERIFDLVCARPAGLALGPQDRRWFSRHKNTRWYFTGSSDAPTAYAALGRGIDLKDLVHEWGGEPNALQALLRHLREQHPEASILASRAQVATLPLRPGYETQAEYFGMARVLDPQAVLQAYLPGTPVAAQKLRDGWKLQIGSDALHPLDDSQLPWVLFGPERVQGISEGRLPMPLWLWGLDGA